MDRLQTSLGGQSQTFSGGLAYGLGTGHLGANHGFSIGYQTFVSTRRF